MAIPEPPPIAALVEAVEPKAKRVADMPTNAGEPIALSDLNIRALKFLSSGKIKGYNVLSKAQLLTELEGFDISTDEVEAAIASAEEAQAKDAKSKRKRRLEKQSGGNHHGNN